MTSAIHPSTPSMVVCIETTAHNEGYNVQVYDATSQCLLDTFVSDHSALAFRAPAQALTIEAQFCSADATMRQDARLVLPAHAGHYTAHLQGSGNYDVASIGAVTLVCGVLSGMAALVGIAVGTVPTDPGYQEALLLSSAAMTLAGRVMVHAGKPRDTSFVIEAMSAV